MTLPGPLDALVSGDGESVDDGQADPSAAFAGPKTGQRDGPLVAVEDVSVAYGDVTVLEDVSLSVEAGEFVGLVGPNGAGKTTLLTAINGVDPPDSGEVRVAGASIGDLSSRAISRRVATVPQDTTVAFAFTAEEIVEMGRTPYRRRLGGDPDGPEAVERALERTETAQFRDRNVASLSGGERQRVVLARALAQETPALVLDEPTASLDVNHQVRTLELVRDLGDAEGKAALAAIHDLDLAARFCDRIAVLADGDLLAVGSPDDVLTETTVRTAFDTNAAVLPNPVTGTQTVTPLPARGDLDLTAHVVGTGQATARTVAALATAGATVTAGVLPEGDAAAATARAVAAETVTAPAFEPVDAATEATARDHLADADVAVVVEPVSGSVRALVRDHDTLVRVTADTDDSDDGQAAHGRFPDPVATASPETVARAVRRAVDRPVEADD